MIQKSLPKVEFSTTDQIFYTALLKFKSIVLSSKKHFFQDTVEAA